MANDTPPDGRTPPPGTLGRGRNRRSRFASCWVCVLVGIPAAVLAGNEARSQDKAGALAATIVDADGNEYSGRLRDMTSQGVAVENDVRHSLPAENLLRLQFPETERTRPAYDGFVWLANGDRFFGRVHGIEQEALVVERSDIAANATLRVPLETIRAFVPQVAGAPRGLDALVAEIVRRDLQSDVVLLHNGDRVSGELTAFHGGAVTIKGLGGESAIERAGIRAVLLNSELISFPPAEGERALLTLADGSLLTVRFDGMSETGVLRAKALFGADLAIPASAIRMVRFLGGRAVYLSDLTPSEYRFTPYLTTPRPLSNDLSVAGRPLRLGGVEFPKGLGMHSECEAVYLLEGKYRRFLSLAGVDDAAGATGSVIFSVDVDGRRVLTSDVRTSAGPSLEVGPFDLTGKTRLTLRVEFGPFADVQDEADWCDAVLVK